MGILPLKHIREPTLSGMLRCLHMIINIVTRATNLVCILHCTFRLMSVVFAILSKRSVGMLELFHALEKTHHHSRNYHLSGVVTLKFYLLHAIG